MVDLIFYFLYGFLSWQVCQYFLVGIPSDIFAFIVITAWTISFSILQTVAELVKIRNILEEIRDKKP